MSVEPGARPLRIVVERVIQAVGELPPVLRSLEEKEVAVPLFPVYEPSDELRFPGTHLGQDCPQRRRSETSRVFLGNAGAPRDSVPSGGRWGAGPAPGSRIFMVPYRRPVRRYPAFPGPP